MAGIYEDPLRRSAYGAAATPIIAQVSPSLYNPYAVGPIQPLPTQRSIAGSIPVAPADIEKGYEERPQTSRGLGGGSPRYQEPPAPSAPAQGTSRISLAPVYAALCLIACVTIPTLGLASYAVDKLNNTFLRGTSSASVGDMSGIARENYRRWNDALQTKDYEKVAALYSTNELSFLPTVSPNFIQTNTDAQEYFKDFLKKLPFGTVTSDQTQSFGSDAYLHSGMYTFQLGPLDKRTPVDARFSYVWRKINGDWKITHHHSSVKPSARRSGQAALIQAEAESVANFVLGSATPEIPAAN